MKNLLIGLLISASLSGCASYQRAQVNPAEQQRQVLYQCEGGQLLTVVYSTGQARLQVDKDQPPLMLQQQKVASGFAYGDGKHSLRGKGEILEYTVGRRAPLGCVQTAEQASFQ